ncbi:hypothetical protein CC86DRAFT_246 [Ophiobolus disseminans]|uniref:Uncharacterized protein n=1 Tax=Ophiobolus disseminans TaxID=1469910 RepID=A0A6A7AJC5_9PLEO|nr:hypothetical protein CC86DRAFT_246 [Ophiobolus disseminans]
MPKRLSQPDRASHGALIERTNLINLGPCLAAFYNSWKGGKIVQTNVLRRAQFSSTRVAAVLRGFVVDCRTCGRVPNVAVCILSNAVHGVLGRDGTRGENCVAIEPGVQIRRLAAWDWDHWGRADLEGCGHPPSDRAGLSG